MARRFPPVKVNLVEQKGWEPWDSGGRLAERASDAAYEDFGNMDEGMLIDLLRDMAGDELTKGRAGPKEWSPRRKTLSDDDFEWLATELDKRTEELEETRFAIADALTWMYEEAMTPSDGDIEDAISRMVDFAIEHYDVDEELWMSTSEEPDEEDFSFPLIAEELARAVNYERQENYYDRYLVFDLGRAGDVEKLLERSKWPTKQVVARLKVEFKRFQEWYLDHFWDALHKEFDDVDISSRTQWSKHWRGMVNDQTQMKAVRQELLEAVKNREASDA